MAANEVIYDKSVANFFRTGEFVLEKGLEIFDIVRREGLGGLWDHIFEFLGTLLSDTLDTIKETILYAAIKKVLIEIGKMLVPGGGFIAIAEKVIGCWCFCRSEKQNTDLIESFVNSMENAKSTAIPRNRKTRHYCPDEIHNRRPRFLVAFFGLGSQRKVSVSLNG